MLGLKAQHLSLGWVEGGRNFAKAARELTDFYFSIKRFLSFQDSKMVSHARKSDDLAMGRFLEVKGNKYGGR